MDELEFVTMEELLRIHKEQLELFGGQDGFVDRGQVESCLGRVKLRAHYEGFDIVALTATYWHGLVSTQGFSDGNKRTGANAAMQFLVKNGYILDIPHEQFYEVSMKIATKEMSIDALTKFIQDHLSPIK